MDRYNPEGFSDKQHYKYTVDELNKIITSGKIIEAIVERCDSELNLYVKLGDNIYGIVYYKDFEMDEKYKKKNKIEVLSKVGKAIVFKAKSINTIGDKKIVTLSRREAQEECREEFIGKLRLGSIIEAKVIHIERYGIFCDIGCGINALLPVINICVARIPDIISELKYVKTLRVVLKSIDSDGRITLTHKELLGTWKQEVSKFNSGDRVIGKVRQINEHGAFIEITPNLCGLANTENIQNLSIGDFVTVNIESINNEKYKIRLGITNKIDYTEEPIQEFDYYKTQGRITRWEYMNSDKKKIIETFE